MLKSFSKTVGVGSLIAIGIYNLQHNEKSPFRAYYRAKEISNKTIKNKIESIRSDDVEWIKNIFDREPSNFSFGVVEGPSGIGKSVAISTAARDFKGVLEVGPIFPRNSLDDILDDVCREITGRPGSYFDNKRFMKKVVDKYIEINKRSPIIILEASERKINEPSCRLSQAGRTLSTEFSLNVLIDCQENAILDREDCYEKVLEMEPMSNEMMRKLPQFQSLFELLRSQGNEEVVLAVCGGVPVLLEQLRSEISQLNGEKNETESNNLVIRFVMDHLCYAKRNIKQLENIHPKMKNIIEMFKDKEDPKTKMKVRGVEYISIDNLPNSISFKRGEFDLKNVFRRSIKGLNFIPANGATSILLRNGGEMDFDKVKQTVLSWPEYKQN